MHLATHLAAFFDRQPDLAGSTGIVAVSGGPDSVVLAHLLLTLQRFPRLVLAHLNHQLRGAESDGDAAFVVDCAARWGVACRVETVDVARRAAEASANLEETARVERYRFLTEVARAEGARWVATGHTADDQAETVLFRLLRGSGLQGLSAMPARRPLAEDIALVRPLLEVRRAEVLQYLHDQSLSFRNDSSNLDRHLARNRLRHDLIPLLQQNYNPAIVDVLRHLAEQARDVQTEVTARSIEVLGAVELPRAAAMVVLNAEALAGHPGHIVREVLRRIWEREGWPRGAMGFEQWRRLWEVATSPGQSSDFPGPVRARRKGRVLQLEPMLAPDRNDVL